MLPVDWLVESFRIPWTWLLILERDLRRKSLSWGILLYRERLNRESVTHIRV
jgi:hypothetical protein